MPGARAAAALAAPASSPSSPLRPVPAPRRKPQFFSTFSPSPARRECGCSARRQARLPGSTAAVASMAWAYAARSGRHTRSPPRLGSAPTTAGSRAPWQRGMNSPRRLGAPGRGPVHAAIPRPPPNHLGLLPGARGTPAGYIAVIGRTSSRPRGVGSHGDLQQCIQAGLPRRPYHQAGRVGPRHCRKIMKLTPARTHGEQTRD